MQENKKTFENVTKRSSNFKEWTLDTVWLTGEGVK